MLEIWFDDLNERVQKEVLDFYGVDASEMNFDLVPLMVFEKEEEDDN